MRELDVLVPARAGETSALGIFDATLAPATCQVTKTAKTGLGC